MPDISMCSNGNCPLRTLCYRYRAVPSPQGQSYTWFGPKYIGPGKVDCEWFAIIAPGDRLRSMDEIEGKG